ncbi:hypothetical protein BJ742DRAFT_801087 [Cladochytrium replicatum]|nr:hypothetical protein BJ742DRAFT_801087 [Cladochytrium replicatum]
MVSVSSFRSSQIIRHLLCLRGLAGIRFKSTNKIVPGVQVVSSSADRQYPALDGQLGKNAYLLFEGSQNKFIGRLRTISTGILVAVPLIALPFALTGVAIPMWQFGALVGGAVSLPILLSNIILKPYVTHIFEVRTKEGRLLVLQRYSSVFGTAARPIYTTPSNIRYAPFYIRRTWKVLPVRPDGTPLPNAREIGVFVEPEAGEKGHALKTYWDQARANAGAESEDAETL